MPAHDHDELHAAARSTAASAAVQALRSRGERITAPRRAVVEVLAGHAAPLSADEVAALLERGHAGQAPVHRATVYRTLELLAELGVVSQGHTAGGAARFHLAVVGEAYDHLHGHCRGCSTVVPLPSGSFDGAVTTVRDALGFVLDPEKSLLAGLCADCGRTPAE